MELTKNFEHRAAENKWYDYWQKKKYFSSEPDNRKSYTIVMPPPNVTGILHMGHALNNTIQDILIRRARAQGKNACWVPGTDHASIATEAKVVQMLREKGINKLNLEREEFLKHAWQWKEQYGGIILQQLKKLGCSADWDRTVFTMDPEYYDSVINVFIDLYNKGYIYRGKRMINWDPKAKTALSDEEVIRREVKSKLYFVRYYIDRETSKVKGEIASTHDSPLTTHDYITIATVRPETILGDTAIAVNPKDERYIHLIGRFAFVPLVNRRIPIIADDYVEVDFGTGALKITPAHDKNDYQIGEKHGLEIIDVMNDDGTMSDAAQLFVGEERFEARENIIKELEAKGHLVKIEDYTNQIGFSERTDVVVEDRLSLQWWIDMKKLYKPALEAVLNDQIKFYPSKFRNLYRNWMENIRDWCISRQLWWGHRIPAWYDEQGNVYVAKTEEEARQQAIANWQLANPTHHSPLTIHLTQDEDVLDTWFSSWLWPFEVFHGYSRPGNADVKYYYPTNTLVTAPEIIFFWVARMIMAGFEYTHEKPFSEVYFTGIVRDELGRKMSKQLGNSPDLLGLIDKYGADAVRFGIMISSPAGNDLLFDVKEESTLKQGSFFINKIWNALKLVMSWESRVGSHLPIAIGTADGSRQSADFAVNWFENRLWEARNEIEGLYKDFRLSEILKTVYSLIWDDFCSWYLEWIKPAAAKASADKPASDETIDVNIYNRTVDFFEELMQLLHPFMPFVTEEIYHQLKQREDGDDLTVKQQSTIGNPNQQLLRQGQLLKEVITALRDIRVKNRLKPRDEIELHVHSESVQTYQAFKSILAKQVRAARISFVSEPVNNTITTVVGKDKFFVETKKELDTSAQKQQLLKDLDYIQGFLSSVEKKLGNERFIQNAKPEVVEIERTKKADAEAKIKAIKESLENLR
ncbi:MAG: valine--tRNA ligase [Bacteroidetes bacterium]|nr:MAG: valine--tRNA ligase [Bacteroidota bacterium]